MSQADCQAGPSGVPYYSQWESPHLVAHFIAGTIRPADDPAWAASGASTPEEYEFWSTRVCGLACLKMILRSRNQPVPATMRLVEQAVEWKAFIRDGDAVAGLIYRPFADWVRHDYGITARVEPELSLAGLSSATSPETPVMASVHSSIRWPQRTPPQRGGHLVLVTGALDGSLRLHNPSGIPGVSQRDTLITTTDFAKFYAERGLVIT